VLGVDPGLTGALALIETSLDILLIRDMPVALSGTGTRREIVPSLLAKLIVDLDPEVVFVERVNALPKQGVSSVFTFGQGYGMIRGVLGALQIPTHLVAPGAWKRAVGLGADKTAARARVMALFPRDASFFQRVKDHDRAEAALLAWYGIHKMMSDA
jgi:crossover junction endodeoxyribonuclease RuvC